MGRYFTSSTLAQRNTSASGFTLVEVMVALAIITAVVAVLYPVLRDSAARAQQINERAIAQLHLSSLYDQIGVTIPVQTGTHTGGFNSGHSWSITITPSNKIAAFEDLVPYKIDLTVSGNTNGAVLAGLSTLRLGSP